MEPAPLVYARSVIAPLAPVDGSRADQVRCNVSASTGAAVKAMRIDNEISAAAPRRRLGRTSLAPEVLVPAGTLVRTLRVGTPEGSRQVDRAGCRCEIAPSRRSDAGEELQHALCHELRGRRVVRGQRAVREVMLVAGVEEELRAVDLVHELAGGVDAALADEDRVVVHAVDLDRNAVRPGPERPVAADRDRRVEEQGPACSRPRLGELL